TYQWYVSGVASTSSEDYEDAEESQVYSVEVTDANGCTFSADAPEIEQLDPLRLQLVSINSSCATPANGSITVAAEGGAPPYTYTWSTGDVTSSGTLGGLSPGTYQVTVTDDDGCTDTASHTVGANSPPEVMTSSITNPSCAGEDDGSAGLTFDPQGMYAVVWDNGATGPNLEDVPAGTYIATVTDGNGCAVEHTVFIADPAPVSLEVLAVSHASCAAAANGSIDVQATGGTPPYTFDWGSGSGSASSITGLSPGSYTITVTDANGCTATASAQVMAGDGPGDLLFTGSDVSCQDGPDGSLNVQVPGGTGPYTYNWWSTDYPGFSATTASISNLAAGTYCVSVTDGNACTSTECHELQLDSGLEYPYLERVEVAVALPGGGLLPIYSARWVAETSGCIRYEKDESVTITDEAFTLLEQGQPIKIDAYSNVPLEDLFVDLGGGQQGMQQAGQVWFTFYPESIVQNGIIDVTLLFTGQDAAGNPLLDLRSASNGLADCVALPELQGDCTWSPQPEAGADDVHHLEKRCFESATISASVTSASAGGCDGSLLLSAPGNAGPKVITVTGNGLNTTVEGYGESYPFTGLCPGEYTITVVDANECEQSITVRVETCRPFELSPDITHATACSEQNGSIAFPPGSISGGTAPYSFAWGNGQTGAVVEGLGLGEHSVTITDAKGCSEAHRYVINAEDPNNPYSLYFTVEVDEITAAGNNGCDGSVSFNVEANHYYIDVSYGNFPYYEQDAIQTDWPGPLSTAYGVEGLCAGSHEFIFSISGSHNDDCTIEFTVEIPGCPGFELASPPTVTKPSQCGAKDGSIVFDENAIAGATPPLLWEWSTGSMDPLEQHGLAEGTYGVTITDANGCQIIQEYDLSLPSDLSSVEVEILDQPLPRRCNGRVQVTGTPGLTVALSSLFYSQTFTIPESGVLVVGGLCGGVYVAVVEDASGCRTTTRVGLTGCDPISPALYTVSPPSSCTAQDGFIRLISSPNGGTPPYTQYLLDENGNQVNVSSMGGLSGFLGLSDGVYEYVVEDAKACRYTESIELYSPFTPQLLGQFVEDECEGEMNGLIWLIVDAPQGQGMYFTVTKDNSSTPFQGADGTVYDNYLSQDGLLQLESLQYGDYLVEVEEASTGCGFTQEVRVNEIPKEGTFKLVGVTTKKSCPFQPTGEIRVELTGGNPPYTVGVSGLGFFTSADGSYEVIIDNIPDGNYNITYIKDDCDRDIEEGPSTVSNIEVGALPEMELTLTPQKCCPGLSDLTLEVVGTTAPYEYAWSNGSDEDNLINIDAGDYTVTVTDDNGCYQEVAATVTSIDPPLVMVDEANSRRFSCDGYSNNSQTTTGAIGQIALKPISGGLPLNSMDLEAGCAVNYNISNPQNNSYLIDWSNGAQNDEVISGLESGTYTVSVTDGCGTHEQSIIVEEETVDASQAFEANTCWNKVLCRDVPIDAIHNGYHDIVYSNMDCYAKIHCNNGQIIDEGLGGTESLLEYIGTDTGEECKCETKFQCVIDRVYQDQINYTVGGDNISRSHPIVLNNTSIYVEETPEALEENNLGQGPCDLDEHYISHDCGTEEDFCSKCKPFPDSDGDCVPDNEDNCPDLYNPGIYQVTENFDHNDNGVPDFCERDGDSGYGTGTVWKCYDPSMDIDKDGIHDGMDNCLPSDISDEIVADLMAEKPNWFDNGYTKDDMAWNAPQGLYGGA
ncbi:MAG TPA: hypothetical protein VJ933_08340, partial [Phaeodactylibacter sp.]|nr:hypothetical protein [Phaeodactylibacter sp.]